MLEGRAGSVFGPRRSAEVSVPATFRRRSPPASTVLNGVAKRTLNAAAVIGLRFDAELTAVLVVEPAFAVGPGRADRSGQFTPRAEYAFRHPLIRTVAYESQLKADRAKLHRRLATAIEQRDPGSADENAALIAEHLEAAGDLREAFDWHMRAGTGRPTGTSPPHGRVGAGHAMSLIVYRTIPGSG